MTKRIDRRLVVLVLAFAVAASAGYVAGRRPSEVHHESVGCLSAEGVISCTLSDGWDVAVPLDVSWTGTDGSMRDGGRPDCLPPTGIGLEGPVRLSWIWVEDGGVKWRQVVAVDCNG